MLTMAPQGFAGKAAAGRAAREGAAAGDWCAAVAQAAAAQAGLFNTAQLFLCKSSSGNCTANFRQNIVLQPSHAVSCEGRLPVGYGRMLGTAKETAENSSDSFSTI